MNTRFSVLERRRLLGSLGTAVVAGMAGCTSFSGPQTATGRSAMITIQLDNADDTDRTYEVTVDWGENNRSEFSGVLQPGEMNSEMIATTGTAPETAQFVIQSTNSSRSGSWAPMDCRDYLVDGTIDGGDPSFDAGCQA